MACVGPIMCAHVAVSAVRQGGSCLRGWGVCSKQGLRGTRQKRAGGRQCQAEAATAAIPSPLTPSRGAWRHQVCVWGHKEALIVPRAPYKGSAPGALGPYRTGPGPLNTGTLLSAPASLGVRVACAIFLLF